MRIGRASGWCNGRCNGCRGVSFFFGELVPRLKESVYQVERTRTNEKKASMSKTTRIEGQQPGVVEDMAMAIVNQMNTQRVVVGTHIKYQITTNQKHYFMESALVNGGVWLSNVWAATRVRCSVAVVSTRCLLKSVRAKGWKIFLWVHL